MRGGKNKKTIEEHIANNTYRPCKHGYVSLSDEQTLKEMKDELYTSFKTLTNEMKKLDLSKELDRYEDLNKKRIESIKAFHSIAKMPVEDKIPTNNKDGFKT
jgi:hypothetical protein